MSSATSELEKFPQESLLIQSARVGLYLILLVLALLSQLLQDGFLNWGLLKVFYSVVFVGLLLNAVPLFFLNRYFLHRRWLLFSFCLDALLIAGLTIKSDLSQSVFLFMYLLVIILCGLVFRMRGALLVALVCSLSFTATSVLGAEMRSMSFLFLLVFNNLAFLIVAWLAGFFSDQLGLLGEKLEVQNLSLRTIQKLNESIVETIPSGLVNTNLTGEILRSNLGATRILGRELQAGDRIQDVLPALSTMVFPEGVSRPQELQFHRGPHSEVYNSEDEMLLRVTRLTQESIGLSESTYLYILEDLSQVRHLEAAVRQSEKMAAVGQLAAGIAHEIRNPLTGISGSIELLSQSSNNDDDRKLTKIILREIDRLNNLISEFLDFAKPEKVSHNPVDLGLVVKEVLALAKSHQPPGLELDLHIEVPSAVRGNGDKLKQAILNIVINAYQAMGSVAKPQLKISTETLSDRLVLRLSDTGSGMSEEVQRRVFEPFMTTKPKGTGLGLAITHKILENHGAGVVVESALGRGTEFKISFPLSSPGSP
jgi:two-component system sensor histidine kinase PilS (NtrC family)